MKSIIRYLPVPLAMLAAVVTLAAAMETAELKLVGTYKQTNLLADTGTHKDPRLLNPWGNAFFSGNPFWINDEGSGVSELIDGKGNIVSGLPFVSIPAPPGALGGSRPTGIVANGTNEFMMSGGPALFIFDTLDGVIAGWNGSSGNKAAILVNRSATAQYTGLAMVTLKDGTSRLYAANSLRGVDVFDGTFKLVKTTGGFVDPNLPLGMTPYGIANIGGNVFVTYERRFAAGGVVNEFTPDGVLIRRFAAGGTLNQPWAVVMAPQSFGPARNDILIGNFGDGTINVFNPSTPVPTFLGQLAGAGGKLMQIPGLWALVVGDGAAGVTDSNAIYFTAGPNGGTDGLFGFIQPGGGVATPTRTRTRTSTRTRTATRRATPTNTGKASATRTATGKATPTATKRATTTATSTKKATPTATYTIPYIPHSQ
jgi:uncharacterized protein (TIGR03118 family)